MSSYCHHYGSKRKKYLRRGLIGLAIFTLIIGLIIFITWAILQPKKPHFIIRDVTLYAFNVTTTPNRLTSNFQVTISAQNPNDKIGIYYDKLDIFATYRSQQITYYTTLPRTYQDHHDVTDWSPFIFGTNVPVAPYNGVSLSQDQAIGAIYLMIKVNGRVRWRVGSINTGRYHLRVTCPAYIPFGNPNVGIVVGSAVKYQLATDCKVNV